MAARHLFPDLTVTHEDLFVSEDGTKVAVRSTIEATQSAEMLGISATGQKVSFPGFDFHHLEGEQIVESWHLEDFLGMALQLGAELTPPTAVTPEVVTSH